VSDVAAALRWRGQGLAFDAVTPRGHEVLIDSGGASGPSPVQLLLFSLASCTAIDIVDITTKMRVALAGLEVAIEGDRAAEPPRRFTSIRMVYRAHAVAAEDRDKVRRALALSEDKYCSVRHTLAGDLELASTLEFA
jgi:putative redox protein